MTEPRRAVSTEHYRPDIDGMRAIAVLMVLGFHLGSMLFKGGYVGVDIFFVISGYLVTGIIYRDLNQGRFSFARFYERRIRRILPALVAMLLASALASYFLLFPTELVNFAHSLLAAIFSYANIYFWTQSDYFRGGDYQKVLLHTWSLSVEEMFYLALPAALFLPRRFRFSTTIWLVVLACASFLTAEWMVLRGHASDAFYMPHARAWELLLGSMLGILPALPRMPRLLRELLGLAGLALIVAANFVLNYRSAFPGATALLPCVGAFLIILTGEEGTIVSSILAFRPLVWIGLISYSVYLWHLPLVLFVQRGAIPGLNLMKPWEKLFVLAVCLMIGWLSWRFIEQPFRTGAWRKLSRRRIFGLAALSGATIASIAVVYLVGGGLPGRFSAKTVNIAAFVESHQELRYGSCFISSTNQLSDYNKAGCTTPDPNRKNLLLIGDSHAATLWYGFAHELPGDNIMEAVVTGCSFTAGAPYDDSRCGNLREYVYQSLLPKVHVDAVILMEWWGATAEPEDFKSTFEWFAAHNIPLIVVGPVPEYDAPLPLVLALSIKENNPRLPVAHRVAKMYGIDQYMKNHADAMHYKYLSVYDAICSEGKACAVYADDQKSIPMVWDGHHLTNAASSLVVDAWKKDHLLE